MAHYQGGDPDDWDVFKHSALSGTDGGSLFHNVINTGIINPATAAGATNSTTLRHFEELLDLLGAGAQAPNPVVTLTQQAAYDAVWTKLDQDQFIKYMLFNFVAGNQDWAHKNLYASIHRTDPAGKWQFHSWDAEHVFRDGTENFLTRNDRGGPTEIHQRLLVNPEYKRLFGDYIHQFMFNDSVLSVLGMRTIFQRRLDEIDTAIRGESARWGDNRREPPYNRGTDWTNEKNRIITTVLPQRHTNMLNNFRTAGLYPAVVAPQFRNNATDLVQHGGNVPAGFVLKIHNGNTGGAGTIYFTLDGSDPRTMWTGAAAPTAQTYSAPVPLAASVRVRSRILNGANWSALNDAFFVVDATPASSGNVVVSQVHYHPTDASTNEIAAGFTNQDDFEFLELMNISAGRVDLSGITFAAGLDFVFDGAAAIREIDPGGRVLIVKRREAFERRYGATHPVAGEFRNLSGLSNAGERLELLASNGAVIKDFTYDDLPPWPANADGSGPALVLINPSSNPDHTNPANWRSSTAEARPDFDDSLSYGSWRATSFTPAEAANNLVSGPGADPDHDALTNAFEYGSGSDPKSPASGNVPTGGVASIDTPTGPQDFAAYYLTVRIGADEASWTVRSSVDLTTWDSAGCIMFTRTENPDGTETRGYRSRLPCRRSRADFSRRAWRCPECWACWRMFSQLGDRLEGVFRNLRGLGKISEATSRMRCARCGWRCSKRDVDLTVAKAFIAHGQRSARWARKCSSRSRRASKSSKFSTTD